MQQLRSATSVHPKSSMRQAVRAFFAPTAGHPTTSILEAVGKQFSTAQLSGNSGQLRRIYISANVGIPEISGNVEMEFFLFSMA